MTLINWSATCESWVHGFLFLVSMERSVLSPTVFHSIITRQCAKSNPLPLLQTDEVSSLPRLPRKRTYGKMKRWNYNIRTCLGQTEERDTVNEKEKTTKLRRSYEWIHGSHGPGQIEGCLLWQRFPRVIGSRLCAIGRGMFSNVWESNSIQLDQIQLVICIYIWRLQTGCTMVLTWYCWFS